MKIQTFTLSFILISLQSFALTQKDTCFKTLKTKLSQEAKASPNWTFESLKILTHKEAQEALKTALAEDNEKGRNHALSLIGNSNFLFYNLNWTAPSNSGNSILTVERKTCEIIEDVLGWSEE